MQGLVQGFFYSSKRVGDFNAIEPDCGWSFIDSTLCKKCVSYDCHMESFR